MAINIWRCIEKHSDGRVKFQRSTHRISPSEALALSKSLNSINMPLHFDLSDRTSEDFEKCPKYQNTYRLDSEKPFKIDPVDRIVKTTMINRLEDAVYDPNECPKLCTQVASEIRKRILKLDFERYKIVVAVTIIEKASQSLESSVGFIWDVDRDNYSTYTFETQTFFAYCLVTGTYYE